jgi:SagB-type dehydrogenase family enzyme
MFTLQYHDATKHSFNRFARSAGFLDWAAQPDPFRRYAGAPVIDLPRAAVAAAVPYGALFDGSVTASPIDERSIGEFLRCAMGLSAWKRFQASRWALRVNPSSGNLHPTESYIVWNGRVCHYAPREHALEVRCEASPPASPWADVVLVGLTSIFWREAWKYGERAFRYCQHDVGHAIGALRLSAAMLGWRLTLLPRWPDADVASLLGIDRDGDYVDAEREAPECLAIVSPRDPDAWLAMDPEPLVDAVRRGAWQGAANRLSSSHVPWEIIDRVAVATEHTPGLPPPGRPREARPASEGDAPGDGDRDAGRASRSRPGEPDARRIILQRRSAVAFDARSSIARDALVAMLRRLDPARPPFDAIDWPAHVHLALFVHRVDGLVPGLYVWLRASAVAEQWRAAMRPDFLWERVPGAGELFLLVPMDVKWAGTRVSCDQDIAGDGFLSLGMIARFESSLHERGESFYRRLFWECGLIGQVLYLEAEAAGARSTGIGCFYDDAVHEVLGLSGHAWQSLYHFSMGNPVEDARLTTESGYGGDW